MPLPGRSLVGRLELPAEVGPLHRANSTTRNRLGLAIYYRKVRFTEVKTQTFALRKSLHDRLLRPAHGRLIGTRLLDIVAQGELVVLPSFHAAPLTALNSLRRNQIRECITSRGVRFRTTTTSWPTLRATSSAFSDEAGDVQLFPVVIAGKWHW